MSHQQIGGCGTAQVVRRDVIARAGGAGAASENPQNDGKKEFVVKIPHAFVVCVACCCWARYTPLVRVRINRSAPVN